MPSLTLPRRFATLLLALLLAARGGADEPAPAPRPPRFLDLSATTEQVASAYVDAYFRRDFDTMERLAGPDASFDDPTADTIFGGAPVTGRTAAYAHLRQTFAGITRIEFRATRRFFSGEHAVFEGEVSWAYRPAPEAPEAATTGMPLVVIVRVKDGAVVSHRDYGDYRVMLRQARAAAR